MLSFIVTWVILALFYVALSGYEELAEPIPLFWFFVSVTGVSALSHKHLTFDGSLPRWPGRLVRLPRYAVWLMWEIAKANWDVILRVIGVRPLGPRMFRYRPGPRSAWADTTLANSITLTPGTVTVEVEPDGAYIIHAISPEGVEGVLSRDMERQVQRLDGEG